MIIYRLSKYRILIINEYWVYVPIALIFEFFIIRKIISHKSKLKKLDELEKLLDQIERKNRLKKIIYLSLGISLGTSVGFLSRGGVLIDSDYIRDRCQIETGIGFLDNPRFRQIVKNLYKYKKQGQIIYITATALCYLITDHGRNYWNLPVTIGDFGLTSLYHTLRKGGAVTLLTLFVPTLMVATGPISLLLAFTMAALGLRLGINNLEFVAITPIGPNEIIKPRMPQTVEVVVLNNANKVLLGEPLHRPMHKPGKECWLAEQYALNPKCKRPEGLNVRDSVVIDLTYEKVVNMKDASRFHRDQFTDQFDMEVVRPRLSLKPRRRKMKMVNFLEKFGDPQEINEDQEWLIDSNRPIGKEGPEQIPTGNKPE